MEYPKTDTAGMSVGKERQNPIPGLIRKVLVSWLLAVVIEYLLLPGQLRSLSGLEGLARMSLIRVLTVTAVFVLRLYGLQRFMDTAQAERWSLAAAFAVLAVLALTASFSWAFFAVCALVGLGLVVYAVYGWNAGPEPAPESGKTRRIWPWVTAGLAVIFFLFVSAWTVGRVLTFSTPTFDFGIFSQMFYNMKESGLPMTTVERDGALSHFAVHVSPTYYLMLPFYCLFPAPQTLQVLQAAVMASAVIPLWLIGKRHGLTGLQRTLLCAVLLLYPAFAGGAGYDIHENCFLTPLILWLLYGIDTKNIPVTALAGLLTLGVKEDAAVYVAVIALWLVVRKLLRFKKESVGELITGAALLGASLGWFFAVTGYLAESGDGVMTYRYDNFIYDGSASLFTVVKAVVLNPMKAVYECVDSETLNSIVLTMLPLLGLPLLTRRYERYILLIPYLLVNLMSDYRYQHDVFFQYNFGSLACLMYLTAVNLADLKLVRRRLCALGAAVLISAGCLAVKIAPTVLYYPLRYVQYQDYYQSIRDKLAQIPEDASVSATTFYTTYFSQREVLYDVRYCSKSHVLEAEYVVLSVSEKRTYDKYNGFDNFVKILEQNGYERIDALEGVLVIYHRDAD